MGKTIVITKEQAQKLNGYISAVEQSAKQLGFIEKKYLTGSYADRENHKVIKDRLQKFIRELTEPTTK